MKVAVLLITTLVALASATPVISLEPRQGIITDDPKVVTAERAFMLAAHAIYVQGGFSTPENEKEADSMYIPSIRVTSLVPLTVQHYTAVCLPPPLAS